VPPAGGGRARLADRLGIAHRDLGGPSGRGVATPARSRGSSRSSQPGSHQLRSPSSSIVAGTSTSRTSVASSSTATASPRPKIFSDRVEPSTNAPNTQNITAAAAVITRAVAATPSAMAPLLSPVSS